jgi:MFS family permease
MGAESVLTPHRPTRHLPAETARWSTITQIYEGTNQIQRMVMARQLLNSYAKTVLQLAAKPEMRGRVMALWGLAWLGSTPIGGPIVGWVGQEFGARWSLLIGGVPTILCGLIAFPVLAAIDRRIARGPVAR